MPNNEEKKVLLRVSHLKQWFPLKKSLGKEQLYVKANDGVSIDIYEGETLGLVGESGCGKSTFGRTLLQLYQQTEGKTLYYGRTLDWLAPVYVEKMLHKLQRHRAEMLALFQRGEALGAEAKALAAELLAASRVGMLEDGDSGPNADETPSGAANSEDSDRAGTSGDGDSGPNADETPSGAANSEDSESLTAKMAAWEHSGGLTESELDAAPEERRRAYTAKVEERNQARKKAHTAFLGIAQVIGGFLVADELAPIAEQLLREYRAAKEIHRLRDRWHQAEIAYEKAQGIADARKKQGKNAASAQARADARKAGAHGRETACQKKEAELNAIWADTQKLRDQYRDYAHFDEYEAYRDGGIDLAKLEYQEMRQLRKDLQLIFQDPYSSLNPRMTVGQIISQGLLAHDFFKKNDDRMQDYVMKTMEDCGLAPYFIHRYPHQFSGGQRQRIGIARSLAVKPKFVVCDEAVSALDVSIQSQVINLLQDLKEQENLTYLFITHDLSVVKYISDRIGVMYLGNLAELADSQKIFTRPLHPYTEALLLAIPTTDLDHRKQIVPLEGDIPSPIRPPKGCKFHTRCKYATEVCSEVTPEFVEAEPGHFVACHHPVDHKVI